MLQVAVKKRRGDFTLNVNFELPTPGVVALFGRSGCGKTTLVNIIAGLLEADAGRVTLDGRVLLDTDGHANVAPEKRRMGCVFQDARLFPHMSVAANLRYASKRAHQVPFVSQERVIDLLELGALMKRRTHELSGGERQRVAIGRALLSQPALLLLDEPLASLDASRREEVLPYLENLRDQLSIPMVYVSHNFEEVSRLATHLVLMEAGTITAQGNLSEMSLNAAVRAIIGPESVGAVVDGTVVGIDGSSGLTRVKVGRGELKMHCARAAAGAKMRVQLLARDLIVATHPAEHLSVRNSLAGVVLGIADDVEDSDLISIDIGDTLIMARITKAATRELGLAPGAKVWALVKTASLRPHPM